MHSEEELQAIVVGTTKLADFEMPKYSEADLPLEGDESLLAPCSDENLSYEDCS